MDFAEVDPRLMLADLAGRRDVLGDPLRLTAGLPSVAVRRHQAVAMCIDGLEVVPVLSLDATLIHLAPTTASVSVPSMV